MRNRKEMRNSILDYMNEFLKINVFDLNEEEFDMLSDEIESITDSIAVERVHDTEYTDVFFTEDYKAEDYSNEDFYEVLAVEEFEFKNKSYTVVCYYEV